MPKWIAKRIARSSNVSLLLQKRSYANKTSHVTWVLWLLLAALFSKLAIKRAAPLISGKTPAENNAAKNCAKAASPSLSISLTLEKSNSAPVDDWQASWIVVMFGRDCAVIFSGISRQSRFLMLHIVVSFAKNP